jgi:hypothetical protein
LFDRADFCDWLTGLLKIDSALTLVCFAGRDNADDFFFVTGILQSGATKDPGNFLIDHPSPR